MKTLNRSFGKRALSVVLVLMMIFSLCAVGITSASAAEVEVVETGANTATIYLDTDASNSFASKPYLYVWEAGTKTALAGTWPGTQLTTKNADGYYEYSFTYSSAYQFIVNNGSGTKTSDSSSFTYAGILATFTGNTSYNVTEVAGFSGGFWADVDGDVTTETDRIDLVGNKLYLPSANVTLFTSEGSLEIGGYTVTTEGQSVDLASGSYTLGGDFSGTVNVLRSSNVSSIHTTTTISVPQGTYQGYDNKDDYSTKGSIVVYGPDGTQKNENTVLSKFKGRGNSSWQASNEKFGKYAFNITLEKKAKLLDESSKSKKYCMVSYNADEARMRNMIVYELAQQIGVEYVPDFEPVDFYNNGLYIGSYLLTDKVEIGDPLVDIVNLDDINEEYGSTFDADGEVVEAGNNYNLYDDDDLMVRASSNGSLSDTSTKNYYKYISNLEEPPASEYADSGFLLEFELNDRFDDEISGFISSKGQQIVCKYPEFATKNEIMFIRDKWNTAEALMYDTDSTYEELDAVIDVESFAKMYLIQELSKNLDGGSTSYYVFYDGGKLHAGVTWDYDWTLGQYIQSGDSKLTVDKQTSGIFKSDANKLLDNPEGWWINSREIYPSTGTLAVQAALCQNSNFWSVVVAEWNESFYAEGLEFADSNVSSASELDGIIGQYYQMIKASTAMDEHKWGFIAKDLISSWGSKDTGDTHADATVWLNNFMYDRLQWMNNYLDTEGSKHTGIYDVDYDIQAPTISADKKAYAAGDKVTLLIDDKTDGSFNYVIFKDGVEFARTSNKSYSFTADRSSAAEYTVKAVSRASAKESAVSEAATVAVEGFVFDITVDAPGYVLASRNISIKTKNTATEDFVYNLYLNGDTKQLIDSNKTGEFTVPTTLSDAGTTFNFTVEATIVVDGETYTEYVDFGVDVRDYTLNLKVEIPETIEAGMILAIKASAESDTAVTYEFYKGDGTLIVSNASGIYNKEMTVDDIGINSYYVVAKTTVGGKEFTATSETFEVFVTNVKEAYDVKICFKSADTLAYAPYITTEGAVNNVSSYKMIKGTRICSNATQTASYYWYEADVQVSKAAPQLEVSIVGSRYALEGYIHLTITESGTIYLALENINFTRGNELQDLTSWDETERNWTMSAANMIYDDGVDKADFSAVAARIDLRTVGDANDDGAVNIKDATAIQKHLAEIVTLDSLAVEISDINSDGKVTVKDATAIQKKLVALL